MVVFLDGSGQHMVNVRGSLCQQQPNWQGLVMVLCTALWSGATSISSWQHGRSMFLDGASRIGVPCFGVAMYWDSCGRWILSPMCDEALILVASIEG